MMRTSSTPTGKGEEERTGNYEALRRTYTYAWSGTRYCDLNMSEANLALIKEDLAEGYDKDDFIAMTVFLVHRTSKRIVKTQDLCIEKPYPESRAASRAELWFYATLDEMAEDEPEIVEVEVEVKEGGSRAGNEGDVPGEGVEDLQEEEDVR